MSCLVWQSRARSGLSGTRSLLDRLLEEQRKAGAGKGSAACSFEVCVWVLCPDTRHCKVGRFRRQRNAARNSKRMAWHQRACNHMHRCHTCMHACMHACMHVCVCTFVRVRRCFSGFGGVCKGACTCLLACVRLYAHMPKRVCGNHVRMFKLYMLS